MIEAHHLDVGDRVRVHDRDGVWIKTALKGMPPTSERKTAGLITRRMANVFVNIETGVAVVFERERRVTVVL